MQSWDGVVRLRAPSPLSELARRIGGGVGVANGGDEGDDTALIARIVPVESESAADGDLAPFLSSRYLRAAERALGRGAAVLADRTLAERLPRRARVWTHAHATWALAAALDGCEEPLEPATFGDGTKIGAGVVLGARVVLGRNVEIGAGAVIGGPGFGWATGPDSFGGEERPRDTCMLPAGRLRRVPQLGGVIIEDDVAIGPLCTIDAGTLSPTRIRRGAKLDAQVHVGHNVEIGEGTIVAAQTGFAGSVRVGAGVLIGGQAGIADHVRIGDGARIAAKSGVIGDVPPGAVVAGYPAVARGRWLRALARLYRLG